ncbi:peroxiredoxin [Variovorax sp. WS11]|uniref:Ohr family peroxiredoxin n=1 Tax=Variovorax sp. WS11 TaxID=1105204 RepID=UPI000D0DF3AA|nr:Ohr family peroxiredoxin [Variovorax sp. WS11]NDZ11729.1 Ohr family peroxiredoxin [Variovorax sp. WS11]PSL86439.1 peroxiredoxin [Variovorax sp. WS11]
MTTTPLEPPPVELLDKFRGPDFLPLYTTTVSVSGGEARHGRASGEVRSDDGSLALSLRLPPELGGPGGGTNPEQLFAAGYAACFHGALSLLAERLQIPVQDFVVRVSVAFGRDPVDGMFMVTADIRVHLPGLEKHVAEELVRSVERICPYTKLARQGIQSTVALAP